MNTAIAPSLAPFRPAAGGITIAELGGELDLACALALREQLAGLLRADCSRLVIDLSKVSHCDASGLAVLIGTGRRARLLGGFLRLAAVSPRARGRCSGFRCGWARYAWGRLTFTGTAPAR
jgi:anti-anti-sigma factor